ncbi:hypothetical protein HYE20_03760 [Mycoplasmopsis bovis]|nr:hypothetical protein [Mycoplasmopsis bovis]QQH24678.1 hypothetical protein HYE20_03760 [Mycoplasmopsis bovis]
MQEHNRTRCRNNKQGAGTKKQGAGTNQTRWGTKPGQGTGITKQGQELKNKVRN